MADIEESLKKDVVKKQLELLRLRNTHPAFGFDSNFTANSDGTNLTLGWKKDGHSIKLIANLKDYSFEIKEN